MNVGNVWSLLAFVLIGAALGYYGVLGGRWPWK